MELTEISLEGFDGREAALEQIQRYVHEITRVMIYRTNDLIHSRRVLWHLEAALPDIVSTYGRGFNVDYARTLALVHDDLEILTGDVQLYDKERMGKEELSRMDREERDAIPQMVQRYASHANSFNYGALLVAAKNKEYLEAQFVSFFDKFDGGGEAWHEVWAGNGSFLRPAGGEDSMNGGYVRRLREFPEKYPLMRPFFDAFPEYLPDAFDFASVSREGVLHTPESLQRDTEYLPYERWKRTIIAREGVALLTTPVESF